MENELGIVIAATPEQVWAVLSDPPRLPQWLTREGPFPHVLKVEGRGGLGECWQAEAMDGQQATFTVVTWDEPQQLAYELTTALNAPLQVGQGHQFDLDIDEGGTLVTWLAAWDLAEESFVAGWLQQRHLARDIERMQMYSLLRLKEIVESEVTNEDDHNDETEEQPALSQDGD